MQIGLWISLFQLEVARAIEAQLVIAVNCIHSRGCFVHGDIFLIQPLRESDHISTEKLHDQYGEPVLKPVNRLDGQKLPPGVPKYAILPIWLGEASEKLILPEARILISDFGEAFSRRKN